jgi:hypothetical protein
MKVFLFVLLATIAEAVGDSVIRVSLQSQTLSARIALFVLGGLLLTLYGTSLNHAPVEFSTVTGLYVAMLFIVFQITNFIFFGVTPTPTILIGGALIVTGGAVIYVWR